MLNIICDFTSVMSTIGRVLLAFVVLMFMVLIHEAGIIPPERFWDSKSTNLPLNGTQNFSKKRKTEKFFPCALCRLRFCAFEGESDEEENSNPKALTGKNLGKG